jgi:DNA-binding NarL/FixJ family response regulator
MQVGVVSSQVLFRKALCTLLLQSGAFSGITEHGTDLEIACTYDKSQPVVLVVHAVEPPDGIEWVHEIYELLPEGRVILLADDFDEEFCMQALEAGAWGCVSTADDPQVLVKAVVKAGEGERWFDHRITNKIIGKVIASRRASMRCSENLTRREWEVLTLVAKGYPDKEIASHLFISKETARSHVKSIYKKLQVSTRQAAAVCYFRQVRHQAQSSKSLETMTITKFA